MDGSIAFSDFIHKVITQAEPCSQNTGEGDLGFGWIYYSLIRNLRPDYVVAIGSRRGFMPFCAGRAVQDNGHGKVIFIDPSYSGDGHPGWSGLGLWDNPGGVEGWIASFGLKGWVTHWKLTSEEAFPRVRNEVGSGQLGVVIIDGAHTYRQSLLDFDLYSSLMKTGVVIFHDATNPSCEVARTLDTLRARKYPVITIPRDAGLALVEVGHIPEVEDKWGYLCAPSNRGELVLRHAKSIIQPGDRVLDIYCGYSPLGFLLTDVELCGWDCDPKIIQKLREGLPQYHWEAVDEIQAPFAQILPERVDVIVGLGVSRGHAAWDPKFVFENVAYLLGRYYPRAALFETAADYHEGDILNALREMMTRLGYRCREEFIQTNMPTFARRRLLLAEQT